MVWFRKFISKYRVTTVLRWIYCSSAAVILPFGVDDVVATSLSTATPLVIFASLFVLIVPTYLPNLLLNYSLSFVKPTVSSSYTYIQPLLAVALSVAMGLDRLHVDTILFALMLFVGVWLVITSYKKEAV
jgi:drug/metabolite transporter (DMT)-like permease